MLRSAKYHRVYPRIWTNPEFRAWSEDARLAALYLLTCPHRNSEGLFRLPMPWVEYELQWAADRTERAFVELERHAFIERDTSVDLVHLVNALRWNRPAGPKQIKGAVNQLAEVPPSPLRLHYLERCDELNPALAAEIRSTLRWHETRPDPAPTDDSDTAPVVDRNSTGTASIPPSPPPAPSPQPHPRSTQEATAGERRRGRDDPRSLLHPAGRARVLAIDALAAMGYPPEVAQVPDPDELDAIGKAFDRGWTADQILAATRDMPPDVRSPRRMWRSRIERELPRPRPAVSTFDPGPAPPQPPDVADMNLPPLSEADLAGATFHDPTQEPA